MNDDMELCHETLERLRLELSAFVAEHYHYDENDSEEGTWSDPDWVADQALDAVLGDPQLWEKFDHGDLADVLTLSAPFVKKAVDVQRAWMAISDIATNEADRLVNDARLFGSCKPSSIASQAWLAVEVLGGRLSTSTDSMRDTVSNYLYNIRGGVGDATSAFCGINNDDDWDGLMGEAP